MRAILPTLRRLVTPVLALLAGLAGASAQAPYAITDAKTAKGIRLVHYAMPGELDQVFAFSWHDRDALHDPAKAGLIQLGPNLLVAGGSATIDGGALDEELKDLSAGIALRRNPSFTTGEVTGYARNFGEAANLLASLLTQPRLPLRTLEREKKSLLNFLKGAESQPGRIAAQIASRLFLGEHPAYPALFFDPASVIVEVTPADVDQWRRGALGRSNLTVVAAGSLDRAAAEAVVDRVFGPLPEVVEPKPKPALTPRPSPRTIAVQRPGEQSLIVMTAPTAWAPDSEGAARNIALIRLGGGQASRLWIALREQLGATYSAASWVQPLYDSTYRLMLQSAVANDRVAPALAAMRAEYQAFRREGVSEAEIVPLKTRLIASHADQMRQPGAAASLIRSALMIGLGADWVKSYPAAVQALTADQVNALIRRHLPEELLTIIVTPVPEGLAADCVIDGPEQLANCF